MLKGWKFQIWFGNLKTLWKLILGFAAVAMVMFVVGLAGLLGLQQVRDQLRIVYENSTLALVNVGESSTNLGLYHDALLNAGRTTKMENFQHALKPLAAYKRQTLAPLAALAEKELGALPGGQSEAVVLDALLKSLNQYFAAAEGAMSAHNDSYSTSLSEEQRTLLRNLSSLALSVEVADHYNTATKKARSLLLTTREIAKAMNDHGQAIASNRARIVLIGAFVAVIFAGAIGYWLSRFFSRGVTHIARVAEQAAAGNLQARAKMQSEDELGHMATAFNKMLDRITGLVQTEEERNLLQKRLTEFLVLVSEVGKGDLSKRGEVTADMFGNMADAFNLMLDRFTKLLRQVREAAARVNQSAADLRETASQMAGTARSQAEDSVRTAAAVENLTVAMRGVAESAEASSQSAQQVLGATERGNVIVQDTMQDMQTVRAAVQRMSKQIKGLGDRSLEISQIVATIKEISAQTNLLALNAAIEAAGAGEAGQRFAIVADQVRKLAENSTQATHEIADLVKLIQTETQDAVVAMEQETQAVETGSASVLRTGEVFNEISQIAQRSAELAQLIANSSADQTASTEQVGRSLKEFTSGAVATQKATDNTRQTIEEMARLAESLTASVAQFKGV